MEEGVVNRPWAIVLPIDSARAIAPLRRKAELLVMVEEDSIWIRGDNLDVPMRKSLLSLPARERYFVGGDERLTPWNRIAPQAKLPTGAWMELADWTALSLPAGGWPGQRPAKIALRLIRSNRERAAGALLCAWPTWAVYVSTAPLFRLAGLTFAVNGADEVIVRGESLPPLPGNRLTDDNGILFPAGWTWSPQVEAGIVRSVLGLGEGECALWRASGDWERIHADAWVVATRSAVRETAREVGRA